MYELITIAGKEYKVRLTIDALTEFKVLNNGVGIVGLMADIQSGHFSFDVEETIKLFHVGAQYDSSYDKTLVETRKMFEEAFENEGFLFIDYVSSTLLIHLSKGKMGATQPEEMGATQPEEMETI